jgi:hypothetical protein
MTKTASQLLFDRRSAGVPGGSRPLPLETPQVVIHPIHREDMKNLMVSTDSIALPIRAPAVIDRVLQEEGKNEQTRNDATKKEEDRITINELVRKSNRSIISISSLFPWDVFANTIQVEETRVTFIFRQLFSSQAHSVEIKDISNVFIQSSLFFATLQIVSRTFVQNDIFIGHLSVKKARQVKMVIEGLRTFAEHDIDTSNYEIRELIAKIEEFHTNKTV